ncbi:MAG: inositol monophosphatase family protein, partial [Streptococcus sp.]
MLFKRQKVKVKEAFLLENKFHFAKEIIYQAGAFLREHLYDDLDVSQKTSATDLVTQMDRKVQDDLVAKILARYPQDAILAEENGLRHNIADGNVWVIDPIDGTTNFITQKADFA